MAKRWFVHRNNQIMGPWSAEAVRAALRQGTIDPFDLVNAEGSPVMRELVEIDEIFQTEQVEYSGQNQATVIPASTVITPPGQSPGAVLALAEPNVERRIGQPDFREDTRQREPTFFDRLRGKKSRQLAPRPISQINVNYDRVKSAMSQNRARFQDPRRYYLVDGRGRILGPKSAGDIQSLYYRGLLEPGVKVKKNQSSVSVPVARFVEVFAQAKGVGRVPPILGSHPIAPAAGAPWPRRFRGMSSSAMNRVETLRRSRYLTMVSVICLILSGAFVLYNHQSHTKGKDRSGRASTIGSKRAKNPPTKSAVHPQSAPSGQIPTQPVPKAPSPSGATVAGPSVSAQRIIEARSPDATASLPRPERQLSPQLRGARSPRTRAGGPPRERPPVASLQKPRAPASQPQGTVRPIPPASPILALAGKDGQVVTIGPLRFRADDLSKCTGKCDLVMVDTTGRSIRAKFFKDSYGDQLFGRVNGVSITGRVMGGGTAIVVSGVK